MSTRKIWCKDSFMINLKLRGPPHLICQPLWSALGASRDSPNRGKKRKATVWETAAT